jgi:hypothetical protein
MANETSKPSNSRNGHVNQTSQTDNIWARQEQIRRQLQESMSLRDGRSVKEIVKETHQRAVRVSRAPRKQPERASI